MLAARLKSVLIGLLFALVVGSQTATLAHAAEFGGDHHEHGGASCELDVITTDDDALVPLPGGLTRPQLHPLTNTPTIEVTAPRHWPPERGPPPRGPPGLSL